MGKVKGYALFNSHTIYLREYYSISMRQYAKRTSTRVRYNFNMKLFVTSATRVMRSIGMRSIVLRSIALLLLLVLANPAAKAAELLMIEQADCPYCDRFNDEIGKIYAKTEEGKRAPLVRLHIRESWPSDYAAIDKPPVTPTFILVHEGKEIDRLLGYQGDEFFWFLLGDMLGKLPPGS